jgi:hypothetical protein
METQSLFEKEKRATNDVPADGWTILEGPQKWEFDNALMCTNARPISRDFKVRRMVDQQEEISTANVRIYVVARKIECDAGQEGNLWGFVGKASIISSRGTVTMPEYNVWMQGDYSTLSPRIGQLWKIPDLESVDMRKLLL